MTDLAAFLVILFAMGWALRTYCAVIDDMRGR